MQNLCMTYYRLQRSPEHVYISSTILDDTLHETECFMTEFNCIYPLTRLKGSKLRHMGQEDSVTGWRV